MEGVRVGSGEGRKPSQHSGSGCVRPHPQRRGQAGSHQPQLHPRQGQSQGSRELGALLSPHSGGTMTSMVRTPDIARSPAALAGTAP